MDTFLTFFENLSSLEKLAWIFLCLIISWVLEGGIPLFQLNYKKWQHAGRNIIFLSTSIIINVLFGVATVGIFLWLDASQFGLLNWINLPVWAELLLAVMWLDFIAQYVAHVMLHKYAWMWRFHMVHHSDTHVDATTGTRHHPGDYFIRETFALGAILLSGMPLAAYVLYRIISIFCTYFSHANIGLPKTVDRLISWVFVSPNMHKFHHHFERPWTDTNFGNIFSIWDRIFGTFVYADVDEIRYGLDVVEDDKSGDVLYQFKLPFDKNIKTDYS